MGLIRDGDHGEIGEYIMRDELESRLQNKYPLILKTCNELEIDDGWYNLVDTLCGMIERHIDCAKKYNNITIPQVEAIQIKSKFAQLRFYHDGGDEKIEGFIDFATIMSESTCEICGNPGTLRQKGWMRVRCEVCEPSCG